jgi:hypothetical protein
MGRSNRRRIGFTAAALVVGVFTACNGVTRLPTLPADAIRLADGQVDTLLNSTWSGITGPQRTVIRSAGAWSAFWAESQGSLTPQPPAPQVDFSSATVIALAMGARPSGGFAIRVRDIYESDEGMHVVVEEISPAPECGVTMAITNPVFAIAVARSGLNVTFIEEKTVRDCD